MHIFQNPNITVAGTHHVAAITKLLNAAYRGETSKQGWTTEANLIEGDKRSDEKSVEGIMQQAGSVFLIYKNLEQEITGCVNLQKHVDKIYLGMFSVLPRLQGAGIGKQLLKAAEAYTLKLNCTAVYMSVITARLELIDWYKRHGYADTGERKAFIEDNLTGKHLQPLEFMVLQKSLD